MQEAAMRLLEADPFYKKGLYGSISVYRFPHSTEGAHSWAVGRKPYVALLMDKPEMRNVKKEKFLARRHLHYLELARCGKSDDSTVSFPSGVVWLVAGREWFTILSILKRGWRAKNMRSVQLKSTTVVSKENRGMWVILRLEAGVRYVGHTPVVPPCG